MYYRILASILVLAFFHTAGASTAPSKPTVEKTVRQFMDQTQAPGAAVVIVRDGKPQIYVFGIADRQTKTPVTPKTIFEVGSITKLFTGILLAEEVIDHQLKLTDNISQHMPELEKNWVFRRITLAQLATHTGGFPFFPPKPLKTTDELNQYLLAWKPSASTDPIYQYSNVSIGLLGRIIAANHNSNINQIFIDKILSPLHMTPMGINVPKHLEADFAQGYLANGKPAPHSEIDLFPAAGELKLTIEDFSKFLQASLRLKGTPKAFSEAITLSQTPLVQVDNFEQALGWQVNSFKNRAELMQKPSVTITKPVPFQLLPKEKQRFNPNALIEKTGGTKGFRAYIALIPNSRSGVAIMTNRFVDGDTLVKTARTLLFNIE